MKSFFSSKLDLKLHSCVSVAMETDCLNSLPRGTSFAPLHEMDDCLCDISMERTVTPRAARQIIRRHVR